MSNCILFWREFVELLLLPLLTLFIVSIVIFLKRRGKNYFDIVSAASKHAFKSIKSLIEERMWGKEEMKRKR